MKNLEMKMTRGKAGSLGEKEGRLSLTSTLLNPQLSPVCTTHSGISIQNPDRQRDGESQTRGGYLVRELLRRAAESVASTGNSQVGLIRSRGGAVAPEPLSTGGFRVFSGGGHTLGSDEMDSTFIPDPDGQVEEGIHPTLYYPPTDT